MAKISVGIWAGALGTLILIGQPQAAVRAQEATPAAVAPGQAVPLALTVKVGDTIRYRGTFQMNFGGNDIQVEQTRKEVVKELTGDKGAVVLVTGEGGKVDAGGTTMDLPPGSPITVTVDKANRILTYKPDQENNPYLSTASQHFMAMIDRVIFPDQPVKPGDSWTTEVDNPEVKGKKVTIKTTFVGEVKADGVTAWKVKQTLEADTQYANMKLKAETTALLDAATGQLIEQTQTVTGLPGSEGLVDWTGTLKRVPDSPAKDDKATPRPAAP